MIKLVRNWFVSVYLDPRDLILRVLTLRAQEDRYLVLICLTGDKNFKEFFQGRQSVCSDAVRVTEFLY